MRDLLTDFFLRINSELPRSIGAVRVSASNIEVWLAGRDRRFLIAEAICEGWIAEFDADRRDYRFERRPL